MRATALWAALLLLAAACGQEDGGRRAGGSGESPLGGGMSLRFHIEPDPPQTGKPVTWVLEVRNEGVEAVTLTFSSGKSGDVTLRRAGKDGKEGKAVYRWSSGRFFTEAVRHEVVRPNRDKVYRLDEPKLAVEPGQYEVVASLASEPAPEPVRRAMSVTGP